LHHVALSSVDRLGDGGNGVPLILCNLGCDKLELETFALSSRIGGHDIRVGRVLAHEEFAELRVHLMHKLAADVDRIDWQMGEWIAPIKNEGMMLLH
jgi:hypothetical protein